MKKEEETKQWNFHKYPNEINGLEFKVTFLDLVASNFFQITDFSEQM